MRIPTVAALIVTVTLTLSAVPAAAFAAGQDGVENAGELVFFYNSSLGGSFVDIAKKKANLSCCTFITAGNGQGQSVKNNAASVKNWNTQKARIFYNSDYAGIYDTIDPLTAATLVNTYNNNASFKWVS